MRRTIWIVSTMALMAVVTVATAWAGFALWFRLPVPTWGRNLACAFFVALGLATIAALFGSMRLRALTVFLVAFIALVGWWSTIKPPAHADWAADVARQATGVLDGDLLTVKNVRNFDWRSDTDFTEAWTTRSYDLTELRSLDLFMSYWAGPEMAHAIMSFGFADGDYLAWSIEVRRRDGGEFSPLADLFKSNPLVIVAADERDVVGVRTNIRGEDVQLYRLKTPPDAARKLLLEYVADAIARSDLKVAASGTGSSPASASSSPAPVPLWTAVTYCRPSQSSVRSSEEKQTSALVPMVTLSLEAMRSIFLGRPGA